MSEDSNRDRRRPLHRCLSLTASDLLTKLLAEMGVRPLRCGSLTLNFGSAGTLESCEEKRRTVFSQENS